MCQKDGVECEYFTTVSTDSLLAYENKYYLQVYLDNCAYKLVNTHIILMTIILSFIKISLLNNIF